MKVASIGVSVATGAMATTRTPWGATSSARLLASVTTAPFDAAYVWLPGRGRIAAVEAVLTHNPRLVDVGHDQPASLPCHPTRRPPPSPTPPPIHPRYRPFDPPRPPPNAPPQKTRPPRPRPREPIAGHQHRRHPRRGPLPEPLADP